jgi:hypothetical protein
MELVEYSRKIPTLAYMVAELALLSTELQLYQVFTRYHKIYDQGIIRKQGEGLCPAVKGF